ncbi:exported protein of unknown function [Aminobacter niigataensis]|nr:exported protein of unknown function [Aminobacter niigataensis]
MAAALAWNAALAFAIAADLCAEAILDEAASFWMHCAISGVPG